MNYSELVNQFPPLAEMSEKNLRKWLKTHSIAITSKGKYRMILKSKRRLENLQPIKTRIDYQKNAFIVKS